MVNLRQTIFALASYLSLVQNNDTGADYSKHASAPRPAKSIAIVGAGAAGQAALKALLDLPASTRRDWDIVVYERRAHVGGVWLPDDNPPAPPQLPASPLYSHMTTNTPHPTMVYPGFLFPPETPLFPSHEHVLQYQEDFADRFRLAPHVRLNHTVVSTSWIGNSTDGQWDVSVRDHEDTLVRRRFDHLVVAAGRYQHPRMPAWKGQAEWLANSPAGRPQRSVIHSLWYRSAGDYAERTVVVVGAGASGRGIIEQIAGPANKLYHSVRDTAQAAHHAVPKPAISHFTADAVVFADGTACADADAVVAATGYELRFPFLEAGGALRVGPANATRGAALASNLRLLAPLHAHAVSLAPQHPVGALAFVGLPVRATLRPLYTAQSLLVAHVLADARLLPPRAALLRALAAEEERVRARGFDPYVIGHNLGPDGLDHQSDYQDALVEFLKARGALPDDGRKFVEAWRREVGTDYARMQRGWTRIEALGLRDRWVRGVATEEEWVRVMKGVDAWQAAWEAQQ